VAAGAAVLAAQRHSAHCGAAARLSIKAYGHGSVFA
jgi:hypothetical protein